MMKKKQIWLLTLLLLAGSNLSTSFADSRDCYGEIPTTYRCVSKFGYNGEDPYNVDRFSNPADDNTKHGCTSFAAYMLAKNNPWMPAISNFDSAQSWAVQARDRVGAKLGSVPHVGDIAQWGSPSNPDSAFQHVAWVDSITYLASGAINEIIIYDDNGGSLRTTSMRYLKIGIGSPSLRWPDTFITFPKSKLGGGLIDRVPALISLGSE